jgi:hypothetical protein
MKRGSRHKNDPTRQTDEEEDDLEHQANEEEDDPDIDSGFSKRRPKRAPHRDEYDEDRREEKQTQCDNDGDAKSQEEEQEASQPPPDQPIHKDGEEGADHPSSEIEGQIRLYSQSPFKYRPIVVRDVSFVGSRYQSLSDLIRHEYGSAVPWNTAAEPDPDLPSTDPLDDAFWFEGTPFLYLPIGQVAWVGDDGPLLGADELDTLKWWCDETNYFDTHGGRELLDADFDDPFEGLPPEPVDYSPIVLHKSKDSASEFGRIDELIRSRGAVAQAWKQVIHDRRLVVPAIYNVHLMFDRRHLPFGKRVRFDLDYTPFTYQGGQLMWIGHDGRLLTTEEVETFLWWLAQPPSQGQPDVRGFLTQLTEQNYHELRHKHKRNRYFSDDTDGEDPQS